MKILKKLGEYAPFIPVIVMALIILATFGSMIFVLFSPNSGFIIMRAPDGSIIDGYGSYLLVFDSFVTVKIAGDTYRTAPENILVINGK